MLGANQLIFALDQKVELDTETIVLHFYIFMYFWFWYQTEIVFKKVYAVIWQVLEITSLKVL